MSLHSNIEDRANGFRPLKMPNATLEKRQITGSIQNVNPKTHTRQDSAMATKFRILKFH